MALKKTYDLHVEEFIHLVSPRALEKELPMTRKATETILTGRETIENILSKKDKRILVIVGPCSIHEMKAVMEYAEKLNRLRQKIAETLYVVMRVYFEKPRTTLGWKGLINDPRLDGSCDMEAGLRIARKLLLQITEMGLPTATEMLDPITPQYVADLICWAAIGARTTESQTHREMASGLSMPVGFKNGTDGDLTMASGQRCVRARHQCDSRYSALHYILHCHRYLPCCDPRQPEAVIRSRLALPCILADHELRRRPSPRRSKRHASHQPRKFAPSGQSFITGPVRHARGLKIDVFPREIHGNQRLALIDTQCTDHRRSGLDLFNRSIWPYWQGPDKRQTANRSGRLRTGFAASSGFPGDLQWTP